MLRAKLTGAAGETKWKNVANENAWASITVTPNSVFGGAKVKFQITHEDPYPNSAYRHSLQTQAPKEPPTGIDYPMGDSIPDGIIAPGLYDLTSRIGGVYGRIVWSGGDTTTNIDIAVNTQMV